jgi:hypothetical protein
MKIFRAGQARGEFGNFEPHRMATLVQGAIDGVMLQWVFDPEAVDLPAAAPELADLFVAQLLTPASSLPETASAATLAKSAGD